jgi:hypothetical protein
VNRAEQSRAATPKKAAVRTWNVKAAKSAIVSASAKTKSARNKLAGHMRT